MAAAVRVAGRAAAATRSDRDRAWRAAVADAGRTLGPVTALTLDFTLASRRWVDLDSLVEVAVAGLRDGGALAPRLTGLDALVATKAEGPEPGLRIAAGDAAALAGLPPPGPVAVTVHADAAPRGGRADHDRAAKRALREALAGAYHDRTPLVGPVWADVALTGPRSLLTRLEPALDALEPVLGRDPRGRAWQEFFPFDDRITWLRVRRTSALAPGLALAVGPREDGAHVPS